jgi:hypothetical protein
LTATSARTRTQTRTDSVALNSDAGDSPTGQYSPAERGPRLMTPMIAVAIRTDSDILRDKPGRAAVWARISRDSRVTRQGGARRRRRRRPGNPSQPPWPARRRLGVTVTSHGAFKLLLPYGPSLRSSLVNQAGLSEALLLLLSESESISPQAASGCSHGRPRSRPGT